MTEPVEGEIRKHLFDRVLFVRHAVIRNEGEYDDVGYCDRKIPFGGSIYWVGVAGGNGELMCAECALNTLLQQLSMTGTIPVYEDNWFKDWERMEAKSELSTQFRIPSQQIRRAKID